MTIANTFGTKQFDSQQKPVDGKQVVAPLLKEEFNDLLDKRFKLGIERYGKPLQTFNGRDAGLDAVEELFDAMMYVKQLRLEHKELQDRKELLDGYILHITNELMISGITVPTVDQYLESIKTATVSL